MNVNLLLLSRCTTTHMIVTIMDANVAVTTTQTTRETMITISLFDCIPEVPMSVVVVYSGFYFSCDGIFVVIVLSLVGEAVILCVVV